jgi:hypothetical protein
VYMENSERQRFEENWKSAFQNAEQRPSDRVWWSIDNALTQAEGGTMHRKVIFYKRLAAASVILALVLAGSTTYFMNESQNELASTSETQIESKTSTSTTTDNPTAIAGNEKPTGNETSSTTSNTTTHSTKAADPNLTTKPVEVIPIASLDGNKNPMAEHTLLLSDAASHNLRGFGLDAYDPLADAHPTDLITRGKPREVTIVRKLPAMPASMMADTRRKKTDLKENLWAAVNASAGSYNSTAQGDRSQSFLLASQSSSFNNLVSASSSAQSKGNLFSVGINMGTRLTKRWVVQGGVSYLNQSQGYTSNFAAVGINNTPMAIVSDYTVTKQNTLELSPTSPYDINSVSELVSVPVQAGYVIINRKFGLQLNSGVATDMFIRNTLTDKSGQLDTFSESAGSNSPYNAFSWSALGGTELSYKIGKQYRVSVSPGFRYAIKPLAKENVQNLNPVMWDLGFRFRYILK